MSQPCNAFAVDHSECLFSAFKSENEVGLLLSCEGKGVGTRRKRAKIWEKEGGGGGGVERG